jgi:NAD+ kinase
MQTPLRFKKVAIVGKYMNPSAVESMRQDLASLVSHLKAKNIEVFVEENTAQQAQLNDCLRVQQNQIAQLAELVIVMGGDGTMLSVARSLVESNVPLIGINRGRFGFLTDMRAEEMLDEIDQILAGEFQQESRMMLCAEVIRERTSIFKCDALNDVVIKSELRLIELEVYINQKFVYRQRSDGLIICSPTGTTAYALSAGGPILHPNLDAIALVPICPHTLTNRPITVPSDGVIEVKLVHINGAHISVDGQSQAPLMLGDVIGIRRAARSVTLLHPKDYCYFDMLRNKLNWG